jgi:hypothetical protein
MANEISPALARALKYAARGFPVVSIHPAEKGRMLPQQCWSSARGQDRKARKDPARALTLRSIRVEFEKFSLASFFAQQGWQIWTGNTRVVFLWERVSVPGNKASASPSVKEIFNLDTWISQQAAILAYAYDQLAEMMAE